MYHLGREISRIKALVKLLHQRAELSWIKNKIVEAIQGKIYDFIRLICLIWVMLTVLSYELSRYCGFGRKITIVELEHGTSRPGQDFSNLQNAEREDDFRDFMIELLRDYSPPQVVTLHMREAGVNPTDRPTLFEANSLSNTNSEIIVPESEAETSESIRLTNWSRH